MDWSSRIFRTANSSFAPVPEWLLFWTLVSPDSAASVWTWRMSLLVTTATLVAGRDEQTSTILWPRLSGGVIYPQLFQKEECNSYSKFRALVAPSLRYSAAGSYAHQLQDREVKMTGMRWDRTAVRKPKGKERWKSGPRTAKGGNAGVANITPLVLTAAALPSPRTPRTESKSAFHRCNAR